RASSTCRRWRRASHAAARRSCPRWWPAASPPATTAPATGPPLSRPWRVPRPPSCCAWRSWSPTRGAGGGSNCRATATSERPRRRRNARRVDGRGRLFPPAHALVVLRCGLDQGVDVVRRHPFELAEPLVVVAEQFLDEVPQAALARGQVGGDLPVGVRRRAH